MRIVDGLLGMASSQLRHFAMMSLAMIVILLSVVGQSLGQGTSTGTITGTVTDQAGAAMVGATVLVHNADTGVDLTPVATSGSGTYSVPALQPGLYDVTASQTGFATVKQQGVRVQVGETIRVDVQMPVASTNQLVTVTTEVPILQTEDTSASEVVSENIVNDIPMSSRRYEQFVLLTPGVSPDGSSGMISFRGLNGLANMTAIDGANNNDNFRSTQLGATSDGYFTSADAIREFQVSESNYSAELGQAAGGSVNTVVKSGTNDLHGDAFENVRYPSLNALDPATVLGLPAGAIPTQSVHQQNQFGGSVGGPIKRDKLFLFVNYDGYRKVTPVALTSSTPNFAALACPTEITATQCSAAKNWITTDLLGTFPREISQDVALGKLDYQLNKANHISATYGWRNWFEPNGTAFASANNSGLTAQESTFLQDRASIVNWTTVIGTDKVNQVLYQYRRDWTLNLPSGDGVPPLTTLTNLFAYGQQAPIPQYIRLGNNQVADNFSFTYGAHAFKIGVNINLMSLQNRGNTTIPGAYTYSTAVPIAGSGCPTTGSGAIFCDWAVDLYGVNVGDGLTGKHWTGFSQIKDTSVSGNLNGVLDPANPAGGGGTQFTWASYAGYFEDTWKVNPKLTLNLGLRYDYQALPRLAYPNSSSALTLAYTNNLRQDAGDFGPRFGAAWNPTKNNVIRVGIGTFFGAPEINTVWSLFINSGVLDQTFNCTPTGVNSTGVCSGLAFPNVLFSQQAALPGPGFTSTALGAPGSPNGNPLVPTVLNPPGNVCLGNPNCAIKGVTPNFTNGRAVEGEVAFQRALPGNLSFTASYILTRGLHLDNFWDANLAFPTVSKSYDIVNSAGATQLSTTLPLFTAKVDPTVGPLLAMFSSTNSWYNAMVLTVRKPLSNSVEVLANYTLSKATDTGQQSNNQPTGVLSLATGGVLNPYNQAAENGTSSLDNRDRFTASVIWEPGRNLSNGIERALLGGWDLSTAATVTSGNGAYSALVSSTAIPCSLAVIPAGKTCASAGGVSALDGGMTGALLGNFLSPLGGRAAWLPRNSYHLPGFTNFDLRIQRQFSVHERYHFEFRVEAFNLFNSLIVQAVNENAWTYAAPGSTGCPSSHTNTCMIPVAGFQTPTTTSSFFAGPRQLQGGFRFEF